MRTHRARRSFQPSVMMLQERIAPVSIAKLPPPPPIDLSLLATCPMDTTEVTQPSGDMLATGPMSSQ